MLGPDHHVELDAPHGLRPEVAGDGVASGLVEVDARQLGQDVDAVGRQAKLAALVTQMIDCSDYDGGWPM